MNQESLLSSLLEETAKLVDPVIYNYTRVSNSLLQKMIDHALRPKGNRERPLLVKLSYEAVNGDFLEIIPAAAAVELLHFSTLILDDILDNSPLRGGQQTVYVAYGYKYALIISEILNSLSLLALMEIKNQDNKNSKLLKIIKIFNETKKDLYDGQFLDIYFEHNNNDINEKKYINMISKTTSSLIKCSLLTGTILGGGNRNQIEILSRYGDYLGIAFQIRDDITEIIGEPSLIGKEVGGDLKQGKMRLPLLHALSNTKGTEHRFLQEVIKNSKLTNENIANCIEILINNGSIEYSKKVISHYCKKAIRSLNSITNSQAKNALVAFAKVIELSW